MRRNSVSYVFFSFFRFNFVAVVYVRSEQLVCRSPVQMHVEKLSAHAFDCSSFLSAFNLCLSSPAAEHLIAFYLIWIATISRIKFNATHTHTHTGSLSIAGIRSSSRSKRWSLSALSPTPNMRQLKIELININGQINVLTSTQCVGTGKIGFTTHGHKWSQSNGVSRENVPFGAMATKNHIAYMHEV